MLLLILLATTGASVGAMLAVDSIGAPYGGALAVFAAVFVAAGLWLSSKISFVDGSTSKEN